MTHSECKGNWGTRLQENPQLILQFVIIIQLTSRRILRDQDEALEEMFYTIYWVCILNVRVSVIEAILVYLSITLVILEQAQAAPEYRFAVQGQRQSYPLTVTMLYVDYSVGRSFKWENIVIDIHFDFMVCRIGFCYTTLSVRGYPRESAQIVSKLQSKGLT